MPGHVVTASHEARVQSSAKEVYRLLADLDSWPRIFAPFAHVARLGGVDGGAEGAGSERIGMWSVWGDTVEHWAVRRSLDEAALRIDFFPESVQPPVTSMRRSWLVEAESERACLVRLEQECRVSEADPGAADTVADSLKELGQREVSAVREAAEIASLHPDLLVTVEDVVDIDGSPAAVYAALYQAGDWPSFMPHVARAEVRDFGADSQLLELETIESHGGTFTTRSARVGLEPGRIAYKQLLLPPLGACHHVQWTITERPGGTAVTSRQTVVLKPSGIAAVLGDAADLTAAQAFVRSELSGKVQLVLKAVKQRVERPAEQVER